MKSFAVIGIGIFGTYVAKGLAEQGLSVIAVDIDEEKIKDISEFVDEAIVMNSTDMSALREAGINSVDVAIVCIGRNIEANIMTVMTLKEFGVKEVIAKASNHIHGEILSKIGANRVLYPEKYLATKLVKTLNDKIFYDTIDIINTLKVVEFIISDSYIQKGMDIKTFLKYNKAKIIAIKRENDWDIDINGDFDLNVNNKILILGKKEDIDKLKEDLQKIGDF